MAYTKLKLGEQHVVDFAFARKTTLGLLWHFIEIEHPKDRLFTKKGDSTAELTHGVRQVRDWENWYRANLGYAQKYLPFGQNKIRTLNDCELILVIGRRSKLEEDDLPRLESLSKGNLQIITFDRLLEDVGKGCLRQWSVYSCSFKNKKIEYLFGNDLTEYSSIYPDEN
jgi:hypothetical protein